MRIPESAQAARILLRLLALGLALNGLRSPWALAAGSALLFALWLKRPPTSTPGAGLWLAWLACLAASAAASAEPLTGWASLSRIAAGPAFLALAAAHWRPAHRRLWLLGLAAGAPLLGLAAAAASPPAFAMTGLLFPYHNYTACVQAAAAAACLAALLGAERPGRERAALGLCLVSALAFILAAHSRGALVAVAVVALAWLARFRRWGILAGLLALAAVAASLLPAARRDALLKRDRPGSGARPEIWASAFAVCRDRPLLGQGPGQFERGFLRHNFPAPPEVSPVRYGMRTAHAHSEPLQLAAEAGWPALLLWLGALVYAWRGSPVPPQAGRSPDPSREPGRAAALALGVQCLFDNLLFLPGVSWLFYSALAVAGGKVGPPPSPRGTLASRALGATGLALACWAWWPRWAVDDRLARARRASGTPAGPAWVAAALAVEPDNADLWSDLARHELRQAPPRRERALGALLEAEERNPTDPEAPLIAAEILRTLGRWSEVETVARRAAELEPRAPQARLLGVEARLRLGRSGAREELALLAATPAPTAPSVDSLETPALLCIDAGRLRALQAEFR